MTDAAFPLTIHGSSRQELRAELAAAGVELNTFAETLLEHPCFAPGPARRLTLTQHTVAELDLPEGGTLGQVIAAAQQQGFELCPPETGPYLRLALSSQPSAPDSVLSAGRIPSGALHVLSAPLSEDDEYPKGFYLRVVDGVSWLRGFRCDDEYRWPPEATVVLRVPQEG